MVQALRKYDPRKGYKVSTWITNPIRWAVMQHQNAYARSGTIADEIQSLNKKFGKNMRVMSLDASIGDANNPNDSTVDDIISMKDIDINYIMDRPRMGMEDMQREREIEGVVNNMVDMLPKILTEREVYVVKEVLRGKTQTEISVNLRLSKVRISQIQASAFEKIRQSPMAEHLRKFIR
jgi:RNA polymerase sigma factor (sigma-70 family)